MTHDFLSKDVPATYQEEVMSKLYKDIENKKSELIKEKMIEKGFGHLIDGLEKRRFPKVCCTVKEDWSFYFADNDTDEGAFIVAIQNYNIKNSLPDERSVKVTVTFNWQDTYPGIVSMKNQEFT